MQIKSELPILDVDADPSQSFESQSDQNHLDARFYSNMTSLHQPTRSGFIQSLSAQIAVNSFELANPVWPTQFESSLGSPLSHHFTLQISVEAPMLNILQPDFGIDA
jgi:hypothetical protein